MQAAIFAAIAALSLSAGSVYADSLSDNPPKSMTICLDGGGHQAAVHCRTQDASRLDAREDVCICPGATQMVKAPAADQACIRPPRARPMSKRDLRRSAMATWPAQAGRANRCASLLATPTRLLAGHFSARATRSWRVEPVRLPAYWDPMVTRRSFALRNVTSLGLVAMVLCACSPGAPKGVDKDTLDAAVSQAIGDPDSCLLIAEQGSGKLVYRYNTHTACARALPACDASARGMQTIDDVLKVTLKDGQARALSCNSSIDASRGVGWAAGPIPGKGLVYAAMMEGSRAFPGRMMADRLSHAFKNAGL
jgi:hypothetical protein